MPPPEYLPVFPSHAAPSFFYPWFEKLQEARNVKSKRCSYCESEKWKQTSFAWKRKEFIWMGAIMLHLQKKVERGHLDGSSCLRWQQIPFAWKWKEVLCKGVGAVAWDERGHYLVEQHSQSWDLDIIKVYQQKQRQIMHCKQIYFPKSEFPHSQGENQLKMMKHNPADLPTAPWLCEPRISDGPRATRTTPCGKHSSCLDVGLWYCYSYNIVMHLSTVRIKCCRLA